MEGRSLRPPFLPFASACGGAVFDSGASEAGTSFGRLARDSLAAEPTPRFFFPFGGGSAGSSGLFIGESPLIEDLTGEVDGGGVRGVDARDSGDSLGLGGGGPEWTIGGCSWLFWNETAPLGCLGLFLFDGDGSRRSTVDDFRVTR